MGNHEEDAIRRQIDTLVEAVGAKDLEGLRQIYAVDVVSYDIDPPLQHVGIEAKLKNWANVFSVFDRVRYEIRDVAVVLGDDLAFGHAFGRLSGTLKNGPTTNGMWVRVTYCFRKTDGAWLITHDHVSVPLDIRSGNGVVDLEP
ncbi:MULTISPECIES: SgcJ/EcaC family oxidoreductase [unclassified Streptomyces]|uniref:YybH family protein n=1 Tax=unclassified Streptomyces TaxID=2593676 RepID=UPI00236589FC|nr:MULTISPECIES: SgcJ/EcaC family oxidoreductase [unclassified Streptomyces]MDF3148114.1 SgcJ/EcaC family oxidoreductase [Streptomyces sp. T21Q-yed]WDF40209.1 SgcJ/EcaC family oxidoreductase [Streptomyces sp. T12]